MPHFILESLLQIQLPAKAHPGSSSWWLKDFCPSHTCGKLRNWLHLLWSNPSCDRNLSRFKISLFLLKKKNFRQREPLWKQSLGRKDPGVCRNSRKKTTEKRSGREQAGDVSHARSAEQLKGARLRDLCNSSSSRQITLWAWDACGGGGSGGNGGDGRGVFK